MALSRWAFSRQNGPGSPQACSNDAQRRPPVAAPTTDRQFERGRPRRQPVGTLGVSPAELPGGRAPAPPPPGPRSPVRRRTDGTGRRRCRQGSDHREQAPARPRRRDRRPGPRTPRRPRAPAPRPARHGPHRRAPAGARPRRRRGDRGAARPPHTTDRVLGPRAPRRPAHSPARPKMRSLGPAIGAHQAGQRRRSPAEARAPRAPGSSAIAGLVAAPRSGRRS